MPTDDYEMTYTLPHEAWYADTFRLGRDPKETREIGVVKAAEGGGCDWEFSIVEVEGIGIQVRMFDDSWRATKEIPELFAGLADLAPTIVPYAGYANRPTLDDVRGLLDRLGFRDDTDRDAPEDYRGMSEAHALRVQAAEILRQADELDRGSVTATS